MKIRRPAWLSRRPSRLSGVALALGLAGLPGFAVSGPAYAADPQRAPIVVALDPGHGGTNLGASGLVAGVYEKNVTLTLAERVRALLEGPQPGEGDTDDKTDDQPRFRVVLCRTTDRLVTIRARARCAEQSGARLFLSLHTNAVPSGVTPGSQRGFEVFVLGPREIEDDATLAALRAPDDATAAWQSHVVRLAGEQAVSLAHAVDGALAGALGAGARRGVKQSGAALDVLRGAGTPAALVEVGFLDDPEEGARLASASGREPIARALATAIRAYTAPGAEGAPAPSQRSRLRAPRPAAPPSSRAYVQARLQAREKATPKATLGRRPDSDPTSR